MNQLERWLGLHLGLWHKGAYPDMDCEETRCFGHAGDFNNYLCAVCYGNIHKGHNADEVVAHTLCNSLIQGTSTKVVRATHYEDFTEEYIRAETDEIRRR